MTKDRPDRTTWRPLYSLGTTDKALAKRKLARVNELLGRGIDPFDAAEEASSPERVREYAEAWLTAREARGISKSRWERSYYKNHVEPQIGNMFMGDVKSSHVRSIVDEAAAKGLKHGSVAEVRGVLNRLFDDAWRAELIESNPVLRVKLPPSREVRKERCILTDEEFSRFIACDAVDLELRMMALVARCEGGMRTGDLHQWDWSMIDRAAFAECFIPRAKTRRPQPLAIPPLLAPFLRAWWERAGKPEHGPVFPVRMGKRAGQEKHTNSHAKRLRAALARANVFRLTPIEVPHTGKGRRTDLGKQPTQTKLAPNSRDPLYFETDVSLPVDFHSFRRAFNTALAEAGVNVQRAMHLASHSDPRVHARYVMRTAAMREIPAEALPQLPLSALVEASKGPGIVTARDDSPEDDQTHPENPSDSSRRERFRTSDPYRVNAPENTAMQAIAHACDAEADASADRDLACFTLLPDDSSRNVTRDSVPVAVRDDVVEHALARAIEAELNERAGGWEGRVAALAEELRARRLARASNVVRLDERERGKR